MESQENSVSADGGAAPSGCVNASERTTTAQASVRRMRKKMKRHAAGRGFRSDALRVLELITAGFASGVLRTAEAIAAEQAPAAAPDAPPPKVTTKHVKAALAYLRGEVEPLRPSHRSRVPMHPAFVER